MRHDAHISMVEAEVRGHALARHRAERVANGRAYACASAIGLPRLWSYVTGAAVEGFRDCLQDSPGGGHERLEMAFRGARERLAARCESLIEHVIPDAALTGILLDGELHVMTAGSGRVYVHRRGNPQRLTPREDPPTGLLAAGPVRCATTLEPGDLVLCGSSSAFSVRAIARVASVLDDDPKAPVAVLASLLTEPAREAGVRAAAIVLRIA